MLIMNLDDDGNDDDDNDDKDVADDYDRCHSMIRSNFPGEP